MWTKGRKKGEAGCLSCTKCSGAVMSAVTMTASGKCAVIPAAQPYSGGYKCDTSAIENTYGRYAQH